MSYAVIYDQPYPAVVHFEGDDGTLVTISSSVTSLNFLDVGIPGPPGPSGSSLSIVSNFAFGDATPQLVGTLPAGVYNPNTRIDILSTFDGSSAEVSIGSLADPELVMAQGDCNPHELGSYQVASALMLGTDTDIYLFIQPGAGATQGSGRYWLDLV